MSARPISWGRLYLAFVAVLMYVIGVSEVVRETQARIAMAEPARDAFDL